MQKEAQANETATVVCQVNKKVLYTRRLELSNCRLGIGLETIKVAFERANEHLSRMNK